MDKRNMPYSLEAEQSVLGAAFISKYALQKICDELESDDFYLDSHSKIFDALSELNAEGKPIDITIVTNKLETNKTLSSVGNIEYLVEIINSVPSASNVDYYINIVHEKAILRRLINVSNDIANESMIENGNVNDILDGAFADGKELRKLLAQSEQGKYIETECSEVALLIKKVQENNMSQKSEAKDTNKTELKSELLKKKQILSMVEAVMNNQNEESKSYSYRA